MIKTILKASIKREERWRMDCIMLLPGKKNYWCSPVDFTVHDMQEFDSKVSKHRDQ